MDKGTLLIPNWKNGGFSSKYGIIQTILTDMNSHERYACLELPENLTSVSFTSGLLFANIFNQTKEFFFLI